MKVLCALRGSPSHGLMRSREGCVVPLLMAAAALGGFPPALLWGGTRVPLRCSDAGTALVRAVLLSGAVFSSGKAPGSRISRVGSARLLQNPVKPPLRALPRAASCPVCWALRLRAPFHLSSIFTGGEKPNPGASERGAVPAPPRRASLELLPTCVCSKTPPASSLEEARCLTRERRGWPLENG